jgi:hypothetical protein
MESLVVRDGIGVKAKRLGQKKPYVHRQRVIDRDNDRYFEKITDYDTGEIIHYCEEPLSQHINHGSAKSKKGKKND